MKQIATLHTLKYNNYGIKNFSSTNIMNVGLWNRLAFFLFGLATFEGPEYSIIECMIDLYGHAVLQWKHRSSELRLNFFPPFFAM